MNGKLLAHILGGLLIILGLLLLAPAAYDLAVQGQLAEVFLRISLLATGVGAAIWIATLRCNAEVNHRMGFLVVTSSWVTACFVGALPYYLAGVFPHFVDAFFESTSGFTGTGASVLRNIEAVQPTLLLWRSMTQWLGGMGIIIFFLAILPILGTGGVQLFRAEATGPEKDKITPRVVETARALWLLYTGLTAIAILSLWLAGLSLFDATNHAFSTIATGGFSTRNAGIAAFDSATVDYVIILFMLLGSINFNLHYRFLIQRHWKTLLDSEFKGYLLILALVVLTTTFANWHPDHYETFTLSLRNSAFTIVTMASSTGFTHENYLAWPVAVQFLIVLLMLMGGMSGSTAGGMKCIRIVAAFKLIRRELWQVMHPRAIIQVRLNQRPIRNEVANSIWSFLFLYALVFTLATLILTTQHLDLLSASTAVVSALSNIGPAFGSLGPFDSYAQLTDLSKQTLCMVMLAGRLELFTLIVLLIPAFWRK